MALLLGSQQSQKVCHLCVLQNSQWALSWVCDSFTQSQREGTWVMSPSLNLWLCSESHISLELKLKGLVGFPLICLCSVVSVFTSKVNWSCLALLSQGSLWGSWLWFLLSDAGCFLRPLQWLWALECLHLFQFWTLGANALLLSPAAFVCVCFLSELIHLVFLLPPFLLCTPRSLNLSSSPFRTNYAIDRFSSFLGQMLQYILFLH